MEVLIENDVMAPMRDGTRNLPAGRTSVAAHLRGPFPIFSQKLNDAVIPTAVSIRFKCSARPLEISGSSEAKQPWVAL